MKLRLLLLIAGYVLICVVRAANSSLVAAQEFHSRAGLPNFFAKLKVPNAEMKVGYLGGSITAQAGWRPKSLAHFQATYPAVKFSEINAAIGGTGSDLGVFRLKQDLLDLNPDLLFVEFAVNDAGAEPEQIVRCMEGIVRQTWRALPQCDICFVYTLSEAIAGPMMEGKYPRAASTMEQVAEYYGIPSIHMAAHAAELAKEGRLIWSAPLPKSEEEKKSIGDKVVFASDGVHPYPETGHELYLQAIVRSLGPIEAESKNAEPHLLQAPLSATNYELAKLLPISELSLSEGIVALDLQKEELAKRFSGNIKAMYRGSRPGETITFRFRGTHAALYDLLGPDCGQVLVTLDDQPARIVPRFDAYSTYYRLATLLIGSELPDVVHSVKIEIHPDQPDKETILARRKEKIDKPERFNGTAIYPGALLLVGELVK
ncbi:MAG: acyl-CoA thioesterase [Chthoniobacteraceae bacterium]|nr:acyl-CoA thioesterase [Chthoniobacteraceae bacterium]